MILFLIEKGEGKRGGEITNARLFQFLKESYDDVFPERLPEVAGDLDSPRKHAEYKLEMVKKYNPDLVIIDISAAYRNMRAVRWLKKHRKKIMTVFFGRRMTFRYNFPLIETAVRFCENYVLKNSDIIYANSEYSANLIRQKASETAKIIIIRPGTTPISMDDKTIDIDRRNRQRPLSLLFVGACTKVKGLEYLIKALTMIQGLDFRLYIAGEYNVKDAYYRRIKRVAEKGGIADKVKFLGFIRADKLTEYYRGSSIFVLPSISEGYGRVLEEALSFGLPIVASKAGAIPEVVEDGVNVVFAKPKDPKILAEAIARLAADPEKMNKMSRANFEKSGKVQTWEMYREELLEKLVPIIAEIAGIYPGRRSSAGWDRLK
jgi:glycosyltransferase involved in cell wall biosynthesis